MTGAPCVLVTGGAGFIGCELSHKLAATGAELVVVDSLHPQVHARREVPMRLHPATRFIPADVTHGPNWDAVLAVARPTTVVHLAAETGTGQSLTEATRHGNVNVVGTTQMLDAFTRHGIVPEHLVLASSRAVYGEGAWQDSTGTRFHPGGRAHEDLVAQRWDPIGPDGLPGRPLPHRASDTEPRPSNIYAATKLTQEHLLNAWGAAMGSAVSILRMQNVYGPGQSVTNSYTGVLTFFARVARAGEVIDVYEDGRIGRDFVFVGDVASALAAAVAKPPSASRSVDIGSGRHSTLLEVANIVAETCGAPPPVVSGRFRDGDVRSAWADIAAARTDLGYQPSISLRDGIGEVIRWVSSQESQ